MKLQALLLLGPTGSGKSPLGNWLEQGSLWDRRCHHFDFGAKLRATVAGKGTGSFTAEEICFLRSVLEAGALLEGEQFPLAARILDAFVARKSVQTADLLVLNGLPRHLEQARALEPKVAVIGVIQLDCDAATVAGRLRRNSGGDRGQRKDDSETLVVRKLAVFENRTRPLLSFYREQGTDIFKVKVGIETQPEDIIGQMKQWRNQA